MKYDHEFEAFVRRHRSRLLATATALTAGDVFLAEDLVQGTIVRIYLAWGRARSGNVEGYARRVLVNAFVDHRRRPFVRRERAADVLPDLPVIAGSNDTDTDLLDALAALPAGMRAAVVLRYMEDMSIEDTATTLRCSAGTVKSQSARGLAKLRAALTNQPTLLDATSIGHSA